MDTDLSFSPLAPAPDAAAEPPVLALGRGRFALVRRLGEGSGAETWLAREADSEASFVLKLVPLPERTAELRLRPLKSAAQALAGVPGSVQEYGWERGFLYSARPYFPGESLAERLRRGAIPEAEAVNLAERLFVALGAIHAVGRRHGRLRPENIFPEGERLVLVDFEDALAPDADPPADAAAYRAPEEDETTDAVPGPWSDFYAAGMILYRAVSGALPFPATDPAVLAELHARAPVPPLAPALSISPFFEIFLRHLLQKDPSARYRSSAVAIGDLEKIRRLLAGRGADPDLVLSLSSAKDVVSEPLFVGRRAEIDFLREQVAHAAAGQGGLLLISAESGGGKTRLLREFRPLAGDVITGEAGPAGERPFGLFAGVVDAVLERADRDANFRQRLREHLADYADPLVEFFPRLRDLFPPRFRELGAEAWAGNRAVRAFMALLDELGSPGAPCCILLDDCQWADELSLKLLTTWARSPGEPGAGPAYALVLAAFRPEALSSPRHPLRNLPGGRLLALRGLNAAEVRALAESMVGWLPPAASDTVAELAGGNPFLASVLVHGLLETNALRRENGTWHADERLLASFRHSPDAFLNRRLATFSDPARSLLTAGAVLGRNFSLAAAAAVAELDGTVAHEALREASARHVLGQHDGTYYFTHDRLREAFLTLGHGDLAAYHSAAAAWLARTNDEAAGEIAHHFAEAGRPDLALPYARQAARRARAAHSPRLAAVYLRLAEAGITPATESLRPEVARARGEVAALLGHYEEAEAAFRRVNAPMGDPAWPEIQAGLADIAFKRGRFFEAAELLEGALRSLGISAPRRAATGLPRALAEVAAQVLHSLVPRLFLGRRGALPPRTALSLRLLDRLSYVHYMGRSLLLSTWAHLKGLNLAELYAPSPELASFSSAHVPLAGGYWSLARGLRYGRRSLKMRRRAGDLWGEGQSLHFLGFLYFTRGRFPEAKRALREAVRLLERTGDRWELNNCRWFLAEADYRTGDLATAAATAERSYREGLSARDPQATGFGLASWARATPGDVPESLLAQELKNPALELHTEIELLLARAVVCLHHGRPTEATRFLREAERLTVEKNFWQVHNGAVLPWLATSLRAELALLPPLARTARRALLRAQGRAARRAVTLGRRFPVLLPHALRERAYAYALAGRFRAARRTLLRSLALSEEQGAARETTLTRAALGEIGAEVGWPESAPAPTAAAPRLGEATTPAATGAGDAGVPALAERFSSLLRAGHRLATALDREGLYADLARAAGPLLRARHCLVYELAGEHALLRHSAPGAVPFGEEEIVDQELLQRAVRARRPVLAEPPAEGSARADTHRPRAALAAPIVSQGKVVACLYAFDEDRADAFGETENQVAHFLVTIAGAALENAEGFARLKSLSEERALLQERAELALRTRDDFLSVASHELKTPLTSTLLQVQMLLRRLGPEGSAPAPDWPGAASRALRLSESQLKHLKRLVDDLTNVAHIHSGRFELQPEPLALDELAREVAEGMRETCRAAGCRIDIETTPVRVRGDRGRLAQVISNLLANAVKYAPGAPITVTAGTVEGRARLTVRDEGPGIADADQARVFGRFERAVRDPATSGFGLGLYIATQIMQAHGGSISLASEPGRGAAFTLDLPALVDN